MKLIVYLGHPAHFYLFKNTIKHLKKKGHSVSVLIKKKDILEDLLVRSKIKYKNILPEGRKDHKVGMALGMLKRDVRLFVFSFLNRPDLLIGTSIEIGHVGTLLRIPSINVNEDDADVVPLFSKISYPWCTQILSPSVCDNGKWENKSIKYEGYHELAYLHPNHFTPSRDRVESYFSTKEPYFLIRFAKLTAHHDEGIKGISNTLALTIIQALSHRGRVYITSERELPVEFEPYRIDINPLDIHHVMAFASLYLGDSQTMAAEAGVLGTPFVRLNDFVGRIGYLAELENKYNLGFGIKPDNSEKLLSVVMNLADTKNLKQVFFGRKIKMLNEKIDVAQFMTWFIENYPKSVYSMKRNSDYQYRFRNYDRFISP
jgi:predicted glycosyltransferase